MLNEPLLASMILMMLAGAATGCYTAYKVVTIIAKKVYKNIYKRNPK
jgi:hypothetical protein